MRIEIPLKESQAAKAEARGEPSGNAYSASEVVAIAGNRTERVAKRAAESQPGARRVHPADSCPYSDTTGRVDTSESLILKYLGGVWFGM